MSGKSSQRSLCQCSNRLVLPHPRIQSRRAFTSTSGRRKHGPVPIFHPTPSEDLSALLTDIRHKIFLPAHLKRPQQNLIYRTRHHAMLQSDPFEVEVGSDTQTERFMLQPIDRTKDVPDSWRSLRRAMELMGQVGVPAVDAGTARRKANEQGKVGNNRQAQEGESEAEEAASEGARKNEYDNLVLLLTGLRIAGRRWKPWQWEIIARTAGENGAAYALLEAARQAERTGLYLYDLRIVREVMWACRSHAEKNGWSAGSCTKALRYVEEFAKLMEEDVQKKEAERAIHKGVLDEKVNPRRQADIVGVAVELAAKRVEALRNEVAGEEDIFKAQEKAESYVQRLLPNIESTVDESSKAVADAKPLGMVADYELLRWVPVLNGLKTMQNNDTSNPDGLIEPIKGFTKKIQDAKAAVVDNVGGDEGGKRRGLIWCNAAQVV